MADVEDIDTGTGTDQYPQVKVPYVHCQDHDAYSQYDEANYEFENTEDDQPLFQANTSSQGVTQPERVKSPSDFLCLSVFSCLCCIWPIGIAAICFSCKSREAKQEGDISSAKKYGHYALRLSIFSIIGGIIIISVWFALKY